MTPQHVGLIKLRLSTAKREIVDLKRELRECRELLAVLLDLSRNAGVRIPGGVRCRAAKHLRRLLEKGIK